MSLCTTFRLLFGHFSDSDTRQPDLTFLENRFWLALKNYRSLPLCFCEQEVQLTAA